MKEVSPEPASVRISGVLAGSWEQEYPTSEDRRKIRVRQTISDCRRPESVIPDPFLNICVPRGTVSRENYELRGWLAPFPDTFDTEASRSQRGLVPLPQCAPAEKSLPNERSIGPTHSAKISPRSSPEKFSHFRSALPGYPRTSVANRSEIHRPPACWGRQNVPPARGRGSLPVPEN